MLRDLERAKQLLQNSQYTCVLCKTDTCYTSCDSGIRPMMTYLSGGYDLSGFAAADKIVGKAAAMLFVLADVKAVYAPVMSETAKEILMQHGIDAEYDQLTDQIINRAGTDLCPMEKAVREIADPQEAFYAIRRTMEYLQSQAKE